MVIHRPNRAGQVAANVTRCGVEHAGDGVANQVHNAFVGERNPYRYLLEKLIPWENS
jgi:hypothetical protein